MTSFYFKAVASDGKLRTGTLHAENDKWVAQELRRQGLTPVYVGLEPKKALELKLPTFSGRKRRDVLFFTQELSTLLNAGVPLDRALTITGELTERPRFRFIVLRHSAGAERRAVAGRQPGYPSRIFLGPVHQHGAGGGGQRIAGARSSSGFRNLSARATICAATSYPRWSIRRC